MTWWGHRGTPSTPSPPSWPSTRTVRASRRISTESFNAALYRPAPCTDVSRSANTGCFVAEREQRGALPAAVHGRHWGRLIHLERGQAFPCSFLYESFPFSTSGGERNKERPDPFTPTALRRRSRRHSTDIRGISVCARRRF